jgi:hypothetical protein
LRAALGHLGESEAEQVELGADRLPGGQLLVGVAPGGDQLAADLGGTDAGEEPVGLELGIGLALPVGDGPDVLQQSWQVLLGGLAAAAVEGIDAGHAGAQLVHPLADGLPVPAEMGLGPDLSASPHGADGLGHEEPSLAPLERLGGVDEDWDHLGGRSHRRRSWGSG